MNPWEVVAAKLDRFFFGHDHDTEIVDGAEQLAEAEETEETWLGYDADPMDCVLCGCVLNCDNSCDPKASPASASARPQSGKRPTPACDIPLSAGVGHPRIPEPELNSSELVALRQLIEERFGRPL